MKPNGARETAKPDCAGRRFAIVVARFHADIADRLVDGRARERYATAASPTSTSASLRFPVVSSCRSRAEILIDTDRFDALVALGAVIRGETPHFDFVAGECARGIMDVQLVTGVPIGFGVLTTDTLLQAEERADPKDGDKGYAAGLAAASLLTLTVDAPRAGFRS